MASPPAAQVKVFPFPHTPIHLRKTSAVFCTHMVPPPHHRRQPVYHCGRSPTVADAERLPPGVFFFYHQIVVVVGRVQMWTTMGKPRKHEGSGLWTFPRAVDDGCADGLVIPMVGGVFPACTLSYDKKKGLAGQFSTDLCKLWRTVRGMAVNRPCTVRVKTATMPVHIRGEVVHSSVDNCG